MLRHHSTRVRRKADRMKLFIAGLALLLPLLGCSGGSGGSSRAPAEETSAGHGYILNVSSDPAITVVERETGHIVQTVALPEYAGLELGHWGSLTHGGTRLWVCSDLNNSTARQGAMEIYDTADFTRVAQFEVGCGVQNVLSTDGRYLFASSTKTKTINVYDVAAQDYLGSFDIGSAPHIGDMSPDGKIYWTTNANFGSVLGYDISGLPVVFPPPLVFELHIGGFLHGLAAHPNGKYLFVGEGNNVHIIDIAAGSVVAQLAVRPHNLIVSPDRRFLVVGESGTERIQFFDITPLDTPTPNFAAVQVAYSFPTPGYDPSHQRWDDKTGKLWVTLSPKGENRSGALWIIDTTHLPEHATVEKTLQVGANPHGILLPQGSASSGPGTVLPPPAQVTGTAATGNAVTGTIRLKDAAGTVRSANIGVNGSFTINVTGLQPPFLLQGAIHDDHLHTENLYYSFATAAGVAHVNPLTHLALAVAAGGAPPAFFEQADAAALAHLSAHLPDALALVQNSLAELLIHCGASGINPFSSPWPASQTGLAALFHDVLVETEESEVHILNRQNNALIFHAALTALTSGELHPENLPGHNQEPATPTSPEGKDLFNVKCSGCHILHPDDHDHSHGTIPNLASKGDLVATRYVAGQPGIGGMGAHAGFVLTAEEIAALRTYVDTFEPFGSHGHSH